MKLSLTAIAALFAATLHSSVATGTRAASSNGNTNAAEDKPNRNLDLEGIVGVGFGDVLGKLDTFLDSKAEAVGLAVVTDRALGLYSLWSLSACLVSSLGTGNALGFWSIGFSDINEWIQSTEQPEVWAWLREGFLLAAGPDEEMNTYELFMLLKMIPDSSMQTHLTNLMPMCAIWSK